MRALLILVMIAGGCSGGATSPGNPRAGTISVSWTGRLHGSFSAPATGRWCAADTLLEVIAVWGDTAVGFLLQTQDSVRAQQYPTGSTTIFSPGRPRGGVALRLMGTVNLLGFEALSGMVTVTRGTPIVSGTIDVRLRPVSSADTLQLKGTFEGVPIVPALGTCGRANRPGGG